jgi:hypothetical protein
MPRSQCRVGTHGAARSQPWYRLAARTAARHFNPHGSAPGLKVGSGTGRLMITSLCKVGVYVRVHQISPMKPALVSQLAAALMDAWERRRDRAAALQVRGSATSAACGPLQLLDRLLTTIVKCIVLDFSLVPCPLSASAALVPVCSSLLARRAWSRAAPALCVQCLHLACQASGHMVVTLPELHR